MINSLQNTNDVFLTRAVPLQTKSNVLHGTLLLSPGFVAADKMLEVWIDLETKFYCLEMTISQSSFG